MRKSWLLLALALTVSSGAFADTMTPRQAYRQETQRKIKKLLGRRPDAEERALIKKHLKLTAKLHQIISVADKHERKKQADRARALLARADEKLYERLKEHAR
jgi:hypothetical protein